MKATEINLIRLMAAYYSFSLFSCGHYFSGNSKINYLPSSMPERDQVIYASIVNVTLA